MKTTYNGRTNRATRLVNLHYNPETIEDLEFIKLELEQLEKEINNPFIKDYIDFSKINWNELEESLK